MLTQELDDTAGDKPKKTARFVMNALGKLALAPLLIAAGCLLTGLYGALHNQISYTIGPDYFHAFKFQQFAIPEAIQNRLGASLVGWLASWWTGLALGPLLLAVAVFAKGPIAFTRRFFVAAAIALSVALVIGAGAVVVGAFTITSADPNSLFASPGLSDPVGFSRAALLHNMSYLAAVIGVLIAMVYCIAKAILDRKTKGRDAG